MQTNKKNNVSMKTDSMNAVKTGLNVVNKLLLSATLCIGSKICLTDREGDTSNSMAIKFHITGSHRFQ